MESHPEVSCLAENVKQKISCISVFISCSLIHCCFEKDGGNSIFRSYGLLLQVQWGFFENRSKFNIFPKTSRSIFHLRRISPTMHEVTIGYWIYELLTLFSLPLCQYVQLFPLSMTNFPLLSPTGLAGIQTGYLTIIINKRYCLNFHELKIFKE